MSDEHPLVIRFGAFGDMVMITPLLKQLYERSGLPCDVIGTGNWTRTMYQHLPYVRNVYTLKSRGTPWLFSREKHRLANKLRQQQHRFVWLLETNKHSWMLAQKSGIVDPVNPVALPRNPGEHITEHWCRLGNESPAGFNADPVDTGACNTILSVAEDEIAECHEWMQQLGIDRERPVICIQSGNKKTMRAGRKDRDSNTKYWHEKNWAHLIDRITQHDLAAQVLLCGVPEEHMMTLDIYDLCQDRSRIFCVARDLPMRRLFALLSIAHSCISVDTGPAHAASALGCPVTVLYGKADARICSPVSETVGVVKLAGKMDGCEFDDSPESWARCHDISLIDVDTAFDGWLSSINQA